MVKTKHTRMVWPISHHEYFSQNFGTMAVPVSIVWTYLTLPSRKNPRVCTIEWFIGKEITPVRMAEAILGQSKLSDIAFMGLRSAIGVIFIVHGYSKIGNDGFIGWIGSLGIPAELGPVIAIGELIPGILLIIGVLTRVSASVLSVIMVGVIFYVKMLEALTGDSGYEFDLILLAACLVIIVMGPGRISLAHVIKKIPRPLQ